MFELFNSTMLEEWAYFRPFRSEAVRVASFPEWLHGSTLHRAHTHSKSVTDQARH